METKKSKKAATLSIETLVIIILAIVVLIVILFIFSSSMREIFSSIMDRIRSALGLWEGTAIN